MKLVCCVAAAVLLVLPSLSPSSVAQVYSPQITKAGQPDTTNLADLAQDIYREAHARTDREKAEAIWRFYLTDGRFVKPGMFYHIAGWAYEEPNGQVLDPIKLLNSYGYGLCYQDGPLLAQTYKAGGFKDARVWFLTGHTVAEVFYDGKYHYFDSDMMGYNPVGSGPLKKRDVASVYEMEHDPDIVLRNVTGPKTSNPATVDYPWYPADVHAGAMKDLTQLFTTTQDNYLYAYNRSPRGHTMDFELRPGERMTRYFRPTPAGAFYLPYQYDGRNWREVPEELAQYDIRTADGPHSQKDARVWATGTLEYRPEGSGDAAVLVRGDDTVYTFGMPSPYVIIDADFRVRASLADANEKLIAETSTDGGRSWTESGEIAGPFEGEWETHPARLTKSAHGERNAVAGSYGYLERFTVRDVKHHHPRVSGFDLSTVFQLNPRTLPALTPGDNVLHYRSGSLVRRELPVRADRIRQFAASAKNVSYTAEGGQGYLINTDGPGEIVFSVDSGAARPLSGFDAGGRFLDLTGGIAPSKFTAETRKVTPWPAHRRGPGTASIAWSTDEHGPWKTIWSYDPNLTWRDGQAIPQVLRWPEVDQRVRELPPGTRTVYVRYVFDGLAIDHFRLAAIRPANPAASENLVVTHVWEQNGVKKRFSKRIDPANRPETYSISLPERDAIKNVALILDCPAGPGDGESKRLQAHALSPARE